MATLNVSIEVPDAVAPVVLEDFTNFWGYQENIEDPDDPDSTIPNPVGRGAFAKKAIITFIKRSIRTYRARLASDQATNVDDVEMT